MNFKKYIRLPTTFLVWFLTVLRYLMLLQRAFDAMELNSPRQKVTN